MPALSAGPADVADVARVPLLRHRPFRLYVSAQLRGSSGIWMLAVLAARLRTLSTRVVVVGAALSAVAEAAAAVMPTHASIVVALGVVGAATLFFLTGAASDVQLAADPAVRGRVLGIYSPVLLGGHALGALLQGRLAELLGVRAGLAVTGSPALVATAAVALALLRARHLPDPTPSRGTPAP